MKFLDIPRQIILDQIYLLELENYDIKRFIRAVFRSILNKPRNRRKNITWTLKMRTVVFLALLLFVVSILYFVSWSSGGIGFWVFMILLLISMTSVFFIYLIIATFLFYPIDSFLKAWIIRKATTKIQKLRDLKIIAITGSYGKTTMKEVLATTLASKFNVVKTSENKNTPIGISRQILKELDNNTEIFVVEMGAYEKGDIKSLCEITRPNISILTGINEAHLERFGSLENTINTKFEITTGCAPDGIILLNADDKTVVRSYDRYVGNQNVHFFSSINDARSKYKVSTKSFNQNGAGMSFNLSVEGVNLGEFKTVFLADYIVGDIIAAFIVGRELDMSDSEIKIGLRNIKPQAHRLQTERTKGDIVVIDDSYNGNPEGAKAAIGTLAQFKTRRKIYVTPGLVETGEASESVHTDIGIQLANVADIVVLIKNSVSEYIQNGLKQGGFDVSNLKVFPSPQKAHESVGDILKEGDVVLFQNDWPDNYA